MPFSSAGDLSSKAKLLQKIQQKSAIIGVIGLGYVGLPLLLRFSEVGYRTIGFDIDENKVNALRKGSSYIRHIDSSRIENLRAKKLLQATVDFSTVVDLDVLLLCLPTPLNKRRDPDLSFLIETLSCIKPYLRQGQLVVLESTTYPGTTDEIFAPVLCSAGFSLGESLFLVYSPEREDPANPDYPMSKIPKICSGHSRACLEVGVALYSTIVDKVVSVSSTRVAEMTKLLENIHRAVNIGLINEMKIVADKMGIDIDEVIEAASTKPFGFVPYYPGPGIGGHCIPVDPFFLAWKAREYGLHTRLIEVAGEINSAMPDWVVSKTIESLNLNHCAVKGALILVVGITYKANVDDMRHSPAVTIMELLTKLGAQVHYTDPYVPHFPKMREHHFLLSSIVLTPTSLSQYDTVIIVTAHEAIDYDMIRRHAKQVIDTRGVYKQKQAHIIKA